MILVTGANGLIGSFICKELNAHGLAFKALVRPSSDLGLLNDLPAECLVHGDMLDQTSLEEAMEGVTCIIHAAAMLSFHKKDRRRMRLVNVEGTRLLVNLALKTGTRYFIYISSVAALGRPNRAGIVDESSQWTPSKWNTYYAETKYQAELEVWRGIQENLDAVIINPSVVLGPGDWERSSTKIFKYTWDEKRYYTDGRLNYVDVRDVSNIVRQLVEKRISGERFIVNAGGMSYKDFFTLAASKMNKRPPSKKVPYWALRITVVFEQLKWIFTGKTPLITKESARVSKNQISYDNTKILRELNFTFAGIDETLEWTCGEFLKKNQYPK